ncbi:MAG: hypothetical protein DRJ51_08100 [Thermoprotei archaeon]|nr:MAG: hypothetical protein DRJ51_08100 [Thermoprotei archaeon]
MEVSEVRAEIEAVIAVLSRAVYSREACEARVMVGAALKRLLSLRARLMEEEANTGKPRVVSVKPLEKPRVVRVVPINRPRVVGVKPIEEA